MKVRKFEIVECPYCKYEYLPAELFVPKYYFGVPQEIERTPEGKLISYEGTSVDLFEKYICDRCDKEFRIVSKLQLTTEAEFPGKFDEEYISLLDKTKKK